MYRLGVERAQLRHEQGIQLIVRWYGYIPSHELALKRLNAPGLRVGAYIVHASNAGNKAELICGVAVMSVYVVVANRVFWRRLYRLAENRYSL